MAFKEFDFIKKIREKFHETDPSLALGIGDDTAVLRVENGKEILVTCDLMTEGVHFSLDYYTPEDIGWRILAANLSDIASMGGKPLFFTMSAAIPPHLKEGDFLDRLLEGVHHCATRYSVQLIGGDTSSSVDKLFIDVSMIGSCEKGEAVKRSGAEPGDLIYLLGKPGRSEAGLKLFLNGWRIVNGRAVGPQGSAEKPVTELKVLKCLYSHLRPQPYVEEGRLLGRSGLLTSMIDTSDGLSSDLYHICEESGVGAEINAAVFEKDFYEPLRPCLQEDNLLDLILHGGEDFLLLFTVNPQNRENLEELLQKQLIYDYINIGVITDNERKMNLRLADGYRKELHPGGWEHT